MPGALGLDDGQTDLSQDWVTRAAVILAAGPVQAAFHIATDQLRIVIGAAVLGTGCCAVLRWHPWEGASAESSPVDPASGYLLGRIDAASALPDLIAGLVPAGAVTVLGACGLRSPDGQGSGEPVSSVSGHSRASAAGDAGGRSWLLHDCPGCPHGGDPDAEAQSAAPSGGHDAAGGMRERVRQRVRADLLRSCLVAASAGGALRPHVSAGTTRAAEDGHGP